MQDSSDLDNNQEKKCGCHHNKFLRIVGWTFAGVVFAAVFALVFGILVKLLWNELMPGIFGVGTITNWQAFGIVILAKLLFGNFGTCGTHHGRHGRHGHHGHHDYRKFMWNNCCNEDDETWKPKGSYHNWKYYEQYWKEEGKTAFEAYIDKVKAEKENK